MNIDKNYISKYLKNVSVDLTLEQQKQVKLYIQAGQSFEQIARILNPQSNLKSILDWYKKHQQDQIKPLSDEQKMQITRYYFDQNISVQEIANQMNIEQNKILNYIENKIMELTPKQANQVQILLNQEQSLEKIAKMIIPKINLKSLQQWYAWYREDLIKPLTNRQEVEAQTLFDQNLSYQEIADKMGVMQNKVAKYLESVSIDLTHAQANQAQLYLKDNYPLEQIAKMIIPKTNLKSINNWHLWYLEDQKKPLDSNQQEKIKKCFLEQKNSAKVISEMMGIPEIKIVNFINDLKKGKQNPIYGSALIYEDVNDNIEESEKELTQHLLPFQKLDLNQNNKNMSYELRKLKQGGCCCKKESKYQYNLLLLGKSGAGKTTLLDSFANYLMSIEVFDKFRYRLVDESQKQKFGDKNECLRSKTKTSTIYHIPYDEIKQGPFFKYKSCINIIDTPGFGDAQGIEQDLKNYKIVCEQIKQLIQLDAVLLVTEHNITRYTPFQEFIFEAIQNIFAKDMKDRFMIMNTFSDSTHPKSLQALKKAGFFVTKHCEFNNGMVFYRDVINNENRRFMFQFGLRQYEKLSQMLIKQGPAINLGNTKQVIKSRDLLDDKVLMCQGQSNGITKLMCRLKKLKRDIINNSQQINQNQTFEMFDIKMVREEEVTDNDHTTCWSCPAGKYSLCHSPCYVGDDKAECACMGPENKCTECGHGHESHRNTKSIWTEREVKEKVILTAKEEAHRTGYEKLTLAQQAVILCNDSLINHVLEYSSQISKIRYYNDNIRKLGFNPKGHRATKYFEQQLFQVKKNHELNPQEKQLQIDFYKQLIDKQEIIKKAISPQKLNKTIEQVLFDQIYKEIDEEQTEMKQVKEQFDKQLVKIKKDKIQEEKRRIKKLNDDLDKIKKKVGKFLKEQDKMLKTWGLWMYELYGIHKRVTIGKKFGARPVFALAHKKLKWDYWVQCNNLKIEDAIQFYLNLAKGYNQFK